MKFRYEQGRSNGYRGTWQFAVELRGFKGISLAITFYHWWICLYLKF